MKIKFLLAAIVLLVLGTSCEITRERPYHREHREARENRQKEQRRHND